MGSIEIPQPRVVLDSADRSGLISEDERLDSPLSFDSRGPAALVLDSPPVEHLD